MIIKRVNEAHTHPQEIETTANPQITEQVEEAVVAQETAKPTKDLPDVFSLQTKSASAKKSSEVPSDVKKEGYFEAVESELFEDEEATQLNSYYYDYYGDLKKYLFVWTLLKTATGSLEGSLEGTQEIYYDKKVISTSTKVTYTTVNGEPTVQHWHKHFYVQTNRFGQTLTYLK